MSDEFEKHLKDQEADDAAVVSNELETLKTRATTMGIKFHPSISVEVLRKRIEDRMNGKADEPDEDDEDGEKPVAKTKALTQRELYLEAARLVRVNIVCMNPNKRELSGDIYSVGNAKIGTFKKYIPYKTPNGYHVPNILLQMLKDRKYQTFVTVTRKGVEVKECVQMPEFTIAELPPLTEKELRELGRQQIAAEGRDDY